MATIKEMQDALNELVESEGAVSIPGLDLDTVVNNMVEVQLKDYLSTINDSKERAIYKKEYVDYYKNQAKQEVENKISEIKMNYSAAKAGIENLIQTATSAIASNAMPAVITAGSATSIPNPAYSMIENKTKKNILLNSIKTIATYLFNILKTALSILFEVPDMVMVLIQSLSAAKQLVNAIPV